MDRITLNALQGAAGAAGGDKVYVEDVFNTHLYSGDGNGGSTSRAITTGMDLDENAGMIWIKGRGWDIDHALFDTIRDATNMLRTNSNMSTLVDANSLTAFTSDGFTTSGSSYTNLSSASGGGDFAAYSFKAAPGFFDVVTWSGNGTPGREITHSLASTPGFIAIKKYAPTISYGASGGYWTCWHRSTGDARLFLNDSMAAVASAESFFGNDSSYIAPTSTEFTVGSDDDVNGSGSTYVAYIFAHDDQQFGDGGDESIIKCGTFATGSSGITEVNIGWEPQWLLVKTTSEAGGWYLADDMRGFVTYDVSGTEALYPHDDDSEGGMSNFGPTSTGFKLSYGGQSGIDLIYMAIRRGPMKTPEDATKVFAVDTGNSSTDIPAFDSGFPVDAALLFNFNAGYNNILIPRLTGQYLFPTNTDDEGTGSGETFDSNLGWARIYDTTYQSLMLQRAPSFFDVVCYEGTGSVRTVPHNLGVAPELMIIKDRKDSGGTSWRVYHKTPGNAQYCSLESGTAFTADVGTPGIHWNDTTPTDSVFTVGTQSYVNTNTYKYIAYLFASCPGVSKVGSETVGSSAIEVNCGFTGGARFVLLKRTDATADWYLYDSLRGIAVGNDPYVALDGLTTQVTNTDYIDPFTTGFKINTSLPAGDYIYLAIA